MEKIIFYPHSNIYSFLFFCHLFQVRPLSIVQNILSFPRQKKMCIDEHFLLWQHITTSY